MRIGIGLLALASLLMVGCANDSGSGQGSSTDPSALTGVEWTLDGTSLDSLATDVPSGVAVTIAFEDGQVHGASGCNTYTGSYEAKDDGSLSFGTMASTMMACDEPRMALEQAYLKALGGVTGFTVGDTLELSGGDTTLTYAQAPAPTPLPLVGTEWSLTTVASGDAVSSAIAGTPVSLTLADDGTASGTAGCNTFHGSYEAGEAQSLTFGALASTKMMCADDVMAQETAVLQGLQDTASFTIEGNQLSLFDADGTLLLGWAGPSS